MSDDAKGAPTGDERRRLLQAAYGRDSSAEERRRALDELGAAAPSSPSEVAGTGDPSEPSVLVSPSAEPELWEDDERESDGLASADAREPKRRPPRRRRVLAGVIAGTIVALVSGAVAVSQSSRPAATDPFERQQDAADRDAPDWLTGAFVVAELRTGQDGLAARLAGSVRRVDDGPLVGWVFRDTESQTTCLAGSRGIDCAGPGDYALNGLIVTVIDPRNPAEHALRYELSTDDGFRSRVLDLDRPGEYRQMDPARWPGLVTECLDDRGFAVAAFPDGELIPAPVADGRRLELEMAMLHCRARFPVLGQYLAVTPRDAQAPTVWPDGTSAEVG